jgi:phenylacetate-CoA ligase
LAKRLTAFLSLRSEKSFFEGEHVIPKQNVECRIIENDIFNKNQLSFTYKNLNKLAQKGYKLTIVPVGTNKDLFLTSCKKFFPLYDQSIIMGYPPFIKDVIDSGGDHGIDWKKYDLRILTAAEGYSESFREYLVEKTGIKNKYAHIVNIYGTVEQGTIAHETSFTALIRSLANKNKKLFQILYIAMKL